MKLLRMMAKVIAIPPNPLRITRITNTTIPAVVDIERSACCPLLFSVFDEDDVTALDDEDDLGISGVLPPDAVDGTKQSI